MKSINQYLIKFVLLGLILSSCSQSSSEIQKKKELAVSSLLSADSTIYSVQEAMDFTGLKGLSVAVFDNYQLSWTETWGVKDTITGDSIDINTAFSTASIAKPLTATLMVLLEEKNMIDLGLPVSRYL